MLNTGLLAAYFLYLLTARSLLLTARFTASLLATRLCVQGCSTV